MRKYHARFLEGWAPAMAPGYSTVARYDAERRRSHARLRKSTSHAFPLTNSFGIRFQKRACKLSGMNTSKTLDLKPFRMNTYRKSGEGVPYSQATSKSKSPAAHCRAGRIVRSLRNSVLGSLSRTFRPSRTAVMSFAIVAAGLCGFSIRSSLSVRSWVTSVHSGWGEISNCSFLIASNTTSTTWRGGMLASMAALNAEHSLVSSRELSLLHLKTDLATALNQACV
jgi:hypothetical protein